MTSESAPNDPQANGRKRSKLWTKFSILVRRIHLYAGLFLLPWVFLYGITGAMYNHQGLFPEAEIISVPNTASTPMEDFPSEEILAQQVIAKLKEAKPELDIQLAKDHGAQFNNDIIMQVEHDGRTHVVSIDPVSKNSKVSILPVNPEAAKPLIKGVRNVKLEENPYQLATSSVSQVLESAGIQSSAAAKPRGWCKLNFLANVDGKDARVTYVLRDGHVDVIEYNGDDGMTPRQFFLRLHTSHGQPPYWNGRMFWSVILDTMAIAMVSWGVTGLIMWWSIKRTRFIGGIVICMSLITAAWLYFSMLHFYATTKL